MGDAGGATSRCKVCDEPLAPGATFCPRCGTRVEDDIGEDDAITALVVDEPTAAPGSFEPTQAMPRAAGPIPAAPAPVAGGDETPDDERRSRTMRLVVAGDLVVNVVAPIPLVVVALLF